MARVLELNGNDALRTAAYFLWREDIDKGATNEDFVCVIGDYIQQAKDYLMSNGELPEFENGDYPIVQIENDDRSRYFPVTVHRVESQDEVMVETEEDMPVDEECIIIDVKVDALA